MRNLLLLVATSSLLAIAGTPARAQVADVIVADIPFGFTVRNTTLSAGRYTINRLGSQPGVMVVRDADGHGMVVFLTGAVQARKEPNVNELIFDRAGDQYFLSEIFEEGNRDGVELQKSRAERRLEKEGVTIEVHSVSVPGLNAVSDKK